MPESVIETRQCKQCWASFDITDGDKDFYEKVSPIIAEKKYLIPFPVLCPDCRQQRRLSFRNERKLYKRKCDFRGKEIVAMYSPVAPSTLNSKSEIPYKVYDQTIRRWDRDAIKYGQEIDFSRPFSEQMNELMLAVPRINLINTKHENSEFCNFSFGNKNSYLCFTSAQNEDLFHTNRTWDSVSCIDCSSLASCNSCYEVIDSDDCKNCFFSQNLTNCYHCYYCLNCVWCQNCIGCCNLVNKSFCVENKQYSKEAYEKLAAEIMKDILWYREKFDAFKETAIRKYMNSVNTEHCSGDAIANSKNAQRCFEVKNLEECKYVCNATHLRHGRDVNNEDNSDLVYQCAGSETNHKHIFNDICRYDKNISYCSLCFYSWDLFGCVGLRHKQYCILNKQYSKEEYEVLVPKLIAHMEKYGEWGEFFPPFISPFGYNETTALEYFPLTREEALNKWFKRNDYEAPFPKVDKILKADELPNIQDATDEIFKQAIECEVSKKPFRISKLELDFYRRHHLPLPRKHPDIRHLEKMHMRPERQLYLRHCDNCWIDMLSVYKEESWYKVYCEQCYNKEVYW